MKSATERPASFLDHNSGAPVTRELWRAVESELFTSDAERSRSWNPSGVHASGRRAKQVLRRARERIVRSWLAPTTSLAVFDGLAQRTVLTSSGTEANQTFLRSYVAQAQTPWFYAADHHDSVKGVFSSLPAPGTEIPVDSEGRLRLDLLAEQLKQLSLQADSRTLAPVFALLWVNNETGVVQDLAAVQQLIFSHFPQALLHWDAVQAWGKIPLEAHLLQSSLDRRVFFSFSGHKIGAFPGVGVLVAPPGVEPLPLIVGKQERALRGGTESLSVIVSLGLAAQRLGAPAEQALRQERLRSLQRDFEARIRRLGSRVSITGEKVARAPQTTHLRFQGLRGDALLSELDLLGFEVSTGSACQAGLAEPSAVLQAMGYSDEEARSALRISFGDQTEADELFRLGEALENCLKLRDNREA